MKIFLKVLSVHKDINNYICRSIIIVTYYC